jgi:hypothetical protein
MTVTRAMVFVVVAGALGGGLLYLFFGHGQSYERQLEQLTSRETLATAMAYLERQVRMAGYGFAHCRDLRVKSAPALGALTIHNGCDLVRHDPAVRDPARRDPARACATADSTRPDAFTVLYADPQQGAVEDLPTLPLIRDATASERSLCIGRAGDFAACDWIVLHDRATHACVLLMATGAPLSHPNCQGGLLLAHDAGDTGPCPDAARYNDPDWPAGGFPAQASEVARLADAEPRHFAVDTAARPPRLVTWASRRADPGSETADAEVIAEGVEDLQIAYACDLDGDGALEENAPVIAGCHDADPRRCDEWHHNVAGDADTGCLAAGRRVAAVRITIVGRASRTEAALGSAHRPAIEDRPEAATTDRHRRIVLSSTVRPRNLRWEAR